MASQPMWSAFVLTIIIVLFKWFVIPLHCLTNSDLINSSKISESTLKYHQNNQNSGSGVNGQNSGSGGGSGSPKFGDRLLPRHRPYDLENLHLITTYHHQNYHHNNHNNNNNNNNNHNIEIGLINNKLNNSIQINYNNNNNNNSDIQISRYSNNKNNIVVTGTELNSKLNLSNVISANRKSDLNDNNNNINKNKTDLPVTNLDKLPIIYNNQLESDNLNINNNNNLKSSDNIFENINIHVSNKSGNIYDQDDVGYDDDVDDDSSLAQAHRLEMSTEFFIVPSSTASSITRSTTIRSGGVILAAKTQPPLSPSSTVVVTPPTLNPLIVKLNDNINNNQKNNQNNITPPTIISTHINNGLRKEPWVIPVLVLSSLSMLMMAAFEVFVLCKAWRTSPSRRHLFLGQMLLLGLFACSGLAAILTVTPTLLSCATVRFGAGVAFALVFASLLVKCVFLISLNSGVYLPAPYQGLLLLFAVLIQVAVGGQWLLTSPPAIDNYPVMSRYSSDTGQTASDSNLMNDIIMSASMVSEQSSSSSRRYPSLLLTVQDLHTTVPLCKTPFPELLFSLIYVVFLILFVAILAIKSRGIRDNYREATYIGLAIGGSIPIWLGWTLCGLAVAERHKDACLAFGLVSTSATVFLVMFMPKGRQLAAMGKEGLYVEDREEQFSSLSRAGSGYSPSFFHFKPIKYCGMGPVSPPPTNTNTTNTGGNCTTTTTTINGGGGGVGGGIGCGNTNIGKHHQAVATLGGDRVALVAAPPSYTRMYHYFPAHLTHPFCYYPPAPPQTPPRYQGQTAFIRVNGEKKQGGLFMRSDEANLYTTLEPTMSSNPNVYFQRGGGVHPGMMY